VRDLYDNTYTLDMLATAMEQAAFRNYVEAAAAELGRQARQ
jgi:hypothetical protein